MQTGPLHENNSGLEDSDGEDVEGICIPETAEIVPAMEFKILQDPRADEDVQFLLHELKKNQEYRFYITALGVGDIEQDILNLEMWSEFTSEIVEEVRGSLATTKSSLSRCKRLLFQLELNTVKSWAMRHSMSFSKVGFDSFEFLTTVADIFVHILHHHMCNGLSDTTNALAVELENIFNRDFCPKDAFGDGLKETIYFISGWLYHAAKKSSI